MAAVIEVAEAEAVAEGGEVEVGEVTVLIIGSALIKYPRIMQGWRDITMRFWG